MSVSTYNGTDLNPLAGVPLSLINNKAEKTEITSNDKAETTSTATKSHTVGDYFDLNGSFVKALIDIAIGDTLVEDTNYVVTNVGDELSTRKGGGSSLFIDNDGYICVDYTNIPGGDISASAS